MAPSTAIASCEYSEYHSPGSAPYSKLRQLGFPNLVPESNLRWFGFQAIQIWSLITIWIWFQDDNRVNDRDFDLILISFQIKSIDFDLFYFQLKDWPSLTKRSKILIKRSKLFIYIKKVNLFWLFDHFLSNSISFRLKSIDFKLFNLLWSCWNQFRHDDSDSDDKFGSKKSI